MSSRLRMLAFESDSSDEEDYYPMPRPRWIRERSDWFAAYDDRDFVIRFRISKSSALALLQEIHINLDYTSNRNQPLSPINQLLVTLRYYATGSTQLLLGDYVGASKSTVHRIIHRVSCAIAGLHGKYISFPESEEELKRTQINFFNIARFPKVIGAMDCTHVRICSTGGDNAELFRNRKNYFSLNTQVICDGNLKITNIVARWPGATHDSTIFNNSVCRAKFESGMYGDAVMLVDAGYASTPYMMSPLENPQTRAEQLYNESQIRTRNVVERTFGVWKRRFPVLALGIRMKLKNIFPIIIATAVLHNILRDEQIVDDPQLILPCTWAQLMQEGQINTVEGGGGRRRNDAARQVLIRDYFESII